MADDMADDDKVDTGYVTLEKVMPKKHKKHRQKIMAVTKDFFFREQ